MKVTKYDLIDNPMRLVPGRKQRQWMDETPNKYAYRCLPLSIANCTGWDLFMPCDLMVSWNGGNKQTDIQLNFENDEFGKFADSLFGCGIITFHPGFLLRTSKDWDLLVTGPINQSHDGAIPLSGVVETNWLEFTFTMNWKLERPGTFLWPCDIPVARIIPVPSEIDVQTESRHITDNELLCAAYRMKANKRSRDISDLQEAYATQSDVGSVKYGQPSTEWDKEYYRGVDSKGVKVYNHKLIRIYPEFGE